MFLPVGASTLHIMRVHWTHLIEHPKLYLDWFSRFCAAHSRESVYFTVCLRASLIRAVLCWVQCKALTLVNQPLLYMRVLVWYHRWFTTTENVRPSLEPCRLSDHQLPYGREAAVVAVDWYFSAGRGCTGTHQPSYYAAIADVTACGCMPCTCVLSALHVLSFGCTQVPCVEGNLTPDSVSQTVSRSVQPFLYSWWLSP